MYEQKAREILAFNVKYYRSQKGWSQEMLAEKLDTAAAYISQVENARRNLRIDTIGRIADVLGITLKKLFSDENI